MPDPSDIVSCAGIATSCYTVAKDFSGPLAALVAAFFVVFFGFSQIKSQKTKELQNSDDTAQRDLKIELFKEVTAAIDLHYPTISSLRTNLFVKHISKQTIPLQEAIDTKNAISKASVDMVLLVESREIFSPLLFRVFRYAISAELHHVMRLFEPERLVAPEICYDLTENIPLYMEDMKKCMQNYAYGDLFGSTLEPRNPMSEKFKVITNDEAELKKLEQYFLTETDWGKEMSRIEYDTFVDIHFPENNSNQHTKT